MQQNGGNQQGDVVRRCSALDNISPFALMDSIADVDDTVDAGHYGLDVRRRRVGVPRHAVEVPGNMGGADMPWDIMEDDKRGEDAVRHAGLSWEEVKVMVEDDTLVISGEHKKEEGEGMGGSDDGWCKERSVSSYDMRFALSDECDKSKVRAELNNGVLLIIVPKNVGEA
uniref:SHSP domain-containing protein n=1 Tax=Oryza meridionalis TaxID=40149 RepID=A0A0E0D981_9ORYZ